MSRALADSFHIKVLTSNAIKFSHLNTKPIGQKFSLNKIGNLEIFRFRPVRQSKRFNIRILQSIVNIRGYGINSIKAIFQPDILLSLSDLQLPPQFYRKMNALARESEIIHTYG